VDTLVNAVSMLALWHIGHFPPVSV